MTERKFVGTEMTTVQNKTLKKKRGECVKILDPTQDKRGYRQELVGSGRRRVKK